jgi:hypothetical protein
MSLGQFDPYATVSAWDLGRLSEAASVADDAIFRFLNTARTNCGVNITDVQLVRPERAQEQAVQPPEAVESPEAARPSAAEPPETALSTNVTDGRALGRIADASAINSGITGDLRASGG